LCFPGVVNANPVDYVERFGPSLIKSNDLPDFVKKIAAPKGITLASDLKSSDIGYELDGDIEALKFINLEKEDLAEYKKYIEETESLVSSEKTSIISEKDKLSEDRLNEVLREIFEVIDVEKTGFIGETGK
jgi:hypothetical protein